MDIEVIERGDKPKRVVCTEQETSADYGYFGESRVNDVPQDTVAVYDPEKILTKSLRGRSKTQRAR